MTSDLKIELYHILKQITLWQSGQLIIDLLNFKEFNV